MGETARRPDPEGRPRRKIPPTGPECWRFWSPPGIRFDRPQNRVEPLRSSNSSIRPVHFSSIDCFVYPEGDSTCRADYVFEPDYKLAPLAEIEAYTKEHKHLPEVPSAKDMTENGVDMAAMNMVLLKKVEELTLHAIALQKDVDAQKALLADQQKAMSEMKAALETMRGN